MKTTIEREQLTAWIDNQLWMRGIGSRQNASEAAKDIVKAMVEAGLLRRASTIHERLQEFLDRGYRPLIRTHMIAYDANRLDEGWTPFSFKGFLDDEVSFHLMGWVVDAKSVRGQQDIQGGTFPTVEQALAYSEEQLDRYAPKEVSTP